MEVPIRASRLSAILKILGADGENTQPVSAAASVSQLLLTDREIVAIDEALDELAKIDPRKAKVIELRFFGGLSVEETVEVLKLSEQSVMRDWKLAKPG